MRYTRPRSYNTPDKLRKLVEAILHERDDDFEDTFEIVHFQEEVESKEIPVWQLKEIGLACDKWLEKHEVRSFDFRCRMEMERSSAWKKKKMLEKEL